jgi:lysophosphatidylcholine acyltransferase / lyso-PAF acetyltransferase
MESQESKHHTGDEVSALFSPFQRLSPPWDAYECGKTVLATVFLLPFRVLFLVLAGGTLWIVSYIAMSGVRDRDAFVCEPLSMFRRSFLALLAPIARAILFVSFGVYHIRTVTPVATGKCVQEQSSSSSSPAYVTVANHLGYIDIIVLFAKYRGSFVAKGDIEKTPIVGTIATALQCMFVREGTPLTSQLISRVKTTYTCHRNRAMTGGCPGCPTCMNRLVIFPEGTTCNGTAMVPFRTGVFNAGLPVSPVGIRFPHKHFNLSWESIRFREHIFRAMTQLTNIVEVYELPVHVPTEAETTDAALYARNVQASIADALEQPIIPLNRKHKFLYHEYLVGKEKDNTKVFERAAALTADDNLLSTIPTKAAV